MHDALGDRMKHNYEDRARIFLPRRTYTLIRIDGKAFHTATRHCDRPFDASFTTAMQETAKALCAAIQGAEFAYTQSDEIQILLTDFALIQSEAWFDGNLQKIVSVSASIATAVFNSQAVPNFHGPAFFDSRVWTIPDPAEVENAFIWRQNDAERNSLQMLARAHFSHKQLHDKGKMELHELLYTKGINWNDLEAKFKRGSFIDRVETVGTGPTGEEFVRSRWTAVEPPIFVKDREFLRSRIPLLPGLTLERRREGEATE